MEFVIIWTIFASVIGIWSRNKGGSFIAGFCFSLILSPLIAGIIVAMRDPNSAELEGSRIERRNLKKCPQCAELVKIEARKCKHCGAELFDNMKELGVSFDGTYYCVGPFKYRNLRDAIQQAKKQTGDA